MRGRPMRESVDAIRYDKRLQMKPEPRRDAGCSCFSWRGQEEAEFLAASFPGENVAFYPRTTLTRLFSV